MQELDTVASRQRPAADGRPEPRKRQQLWWWRADVLGGAVELRIPGQQFAGAAPHAIDAEQAVEQRAEQWQRYADGNPSECRLRAAFVEEGVQRRECGGDEADGGEDGRQKLASLHGANV